jgi:hypothetical protein
MKRFSSEYIFWIFLIFVAIELGITSYAATLKGVIRENEVSGSPMADVPIPADGAGPTTSSSFGEFEFTFPEKNAGDITKLRPNKAGYVVVNDIELEGVVLPTNADAKNVLVILSIPTKREENAVPYYRLTGIQEIEADYEKKLKTLQDAHQADAEAIFKLQKQRDENKATAEEIAQRFAKSSADQNLELYNKAAKLYLAGDFDQALGVLNDQAVDQAAEDAKRLKSKPKKPRIRQYVQAF